MKRVLYLGYFDLPNHKRIVPLAGLTMMDYVSCAIQKAGFDCVIISPAQAAENKSLEIVDLEDGRQVLFLPTRKLAAKLNVFKRMFLKVWRQITLYKLLYEQLNDGDILLVYHSLAYINVLKRLRKKKRFTLVLQVCEIYADVLENKKKRIEELNWINEADAYIFSTTQLERLVNEKKKPYQVCLGTYKEEKKIVQYKTNDKYVHVLYAGTFDPRKGGMQAVAAAAFLPANYHLHIIGFGTEEEVDLLKRQIDDLSKSSACIISYDGCFYGQDYLKFLQSCDIGLSTQNPMAAFNDTSFPSKILSYMSNGLHVVSIRIPAIEESSVGDLITYYDVQNPEEIAKAIQRVNLDVTGKEQDLIRNLDADMQQGLRKMFNSFT